MATLTVTITESLPDYNGSDNDLTLTNAEMYHFIKENLDFDQIIWEFGDDDNPDWVHVSYVSPEDNRNRCLKAYREDGKTKYMVI